MLKKTMQFQKRHIAIFLFSIYFILYVLSPICYTEDEISSEVNAAAYQTNLKTKSIRIIWELILSKHFNQNNTENSQPNVKLLIKKARVLVSSGSVVKLTSSGSAEFDHIDSIFSRNFYAWMDKDAKPEFRTDAYLSVSGTSPPSLS